MSEAVKLLQAINTSMTRLVQLSGSTGAATSASTIASDAAQAVQDAVSEQRSLRLRDERIKQMKSEVMLAAREARTRDEARKAMEAVTRELNKLRTNTTSDITSLRNMRSVMQDFARSVRGLSESDLRSLSKNFDQLGGPLAGFSKALMDGGDGVSTFISKVFDQTEAMSTLIAEYDDLQKATAKLKEMQKRVVADGSAKHKEAMARIDVQTREIAKRQKAMGESAKDLVAEHLGENIEDAGEALNRLRQHVDASARALTTISGDLTNGLQRSVGAITKNNTHMTRIAETWRGVAANPVVKFAAAAVGANMLLHRDNDSSSFIGDATSTFTTGIDMPFWHASMRSAGAGMSIQEFKNMLIEASSNSSMTKQDLAANAEQIFGNSLEMGRTHRTLLGVWGSNEDAMTHIVKELQLANELGTDPRNTSQNALARANIMRNAQDMAGLGPSSHVDTLVNDLIETSESFSILRGSSKKTSVQMAESATKYMAQMHLMGMSADEAAAQLKKVGSDSTTNPADRVTSALKEITVLRQFGASEGTLQRWFNATRSLNVVEANKQRNIALHQAAPGFAALQERQTHGGSNVRGGERDWAKLSILNTLAPQLAQDLIGAQRQEDRAGNMSPNARNATELFAQAPARLSEAAQHADDAAAKFLQVVKDLDGLVTKNQVFGAGAGLVGVAGTLALNVIAMKVAQAIPLGAIFSKMVGPLKSLIPGLGRTVAPVATAEAAAAANAAATAAEATAATARVATATAEVAPTVAPVAAVSRFGTAARLAGRIAVPIAAVGSGYASYEEALQHGSSKHDATVKGVGSGVGAGLGFAGGAAAGAAIGSLFFGVGSVPGAIIGGLLGLAGSYVGSNIGETVADGLFGTDNDPRAHGSSPSNDIALANISRILNDNGQQTVSQLEMANKSLALLVEFAAASSMSNDKRAARAFVSRSYRTDVRTIIANGLL